MMGRISMGKSVTVKLTPHETEIIKEVGRVFGFSFRDTVYRLIVIGLKLAWHLEVEDKHGR